MKFRNLVLGMMTCAALAACSNADLVEENVGRLEGDAYVAVTISNPAAALGRAGVAGAEEAGTKSESAVIDATFVFFDASGNYITNIKKSGTDLGFADEGVSESKTVLVLNNATITPASIVVFLNAPASLTIEQPLAALMEDAKDYGMKDNSFVMSNAAIKVGDAIQVATPLTGHIKNKEAEAMKSPVVIYVERTLAKVNVTKAANLETVPTNTTLNGVEITLEPRIVGWVLSGTNKTSYILKNATVNWGEWAYGANRSFWAEDVNYASFASSQTGDLTFKSYNNALNEPADSYCLENTLTNAFYGGTDVAYTHLLVTAQIFNKDTNKEISSFCSYNGLYYTEDDLKKQFVSGMSAYKYDNRAITAADIEFVMAKENGKKAYQAVAKFIEEEKASEGAAAALAAKGKFLYYKDGKAYFWTAVEHFGTDEVAGAVGVVRNHVYKLSLNKISGMGTPVIDPTDPIIPEKPSDDNSYLAAKVNILPWKIVSQDVELK